MRSVAYIWAVLAALTGLLVHVRADEPTLARLSFWVAPERMSEFEATYEAQVGPVLKKHGLVESSQRSRATADSVFSRLIHVDSPAAVVAQKKALGNDPAWQDVLRSLGTAFGTTGDQGYIRHRFGLYAVVAGAGKTVMAGAGFRQGLWQSFTVRDGLPAGRISSIVQDRKGNLWFGTNYGGVSRYDGAQFVTFTSEDGLADNDATTMVKDRQGNLWIGTGEGLCRYDGVQFVTFTTEDGLAHNYVRSLWEDRQGNLWVGTSGGVSRFDGREFATFTTEDGLAGNSVISIMDDRQGNLWFGTRNWGMSRYDGKAFTTFTVEDGLADNWVSSIVEDRQGHLWVGTAGWRGGRGRGGVSRYVGRSLSPIPPRTAWRTITFGGFGRIVKVICGSAL